MPKNSFLAHGILPISKPLTHIPAGAVKSEEQGARADQGMSRRQRHLKNIHVQPLQINSNGELHELLFPAPKGLATLSVPLPLHSP